MTAIILWLMLIVTAEFICMVLLERGWANAIKEWKDALYQLNESIEERHNLIDELKLFNETMADDEAYCSERIHSLEIEKLDEMNKVESCENVIAALKTQIATAQAEITRLEGINETALHLLTQYGDKADEMLNLQQKLYPEYERLTAENEKLRKLLDWALRPEAHAALMAEYAKAGKVTEGCESNIPY
jgi:chromosome segregation ATPase